MVEWIGMFVLGLAAVPVWLVFREWRIVQQPPGLFRAVGTVVRRPDSIAAREGRIGRYRDTDIYERIRFGGQEYEFTGVAPPAYKEWLRPSELYLEPGLLYVAQPAYRFKGARR